MGGRRATERVETGTAGGLLHEQGGGPGGDLTPLGAVAVDREEEGPGGDRSRPAPCPEWPDDAGVEAGAEGDAQLVALHLLVGRAPGA